VVVPPPTPAEPESIAKAREALDQALKAPAAQPATPVAQPGMPAATASSPIVMSRPGQPEPENIAKAREALEKKMAELEAQGGAQAQPAPQGAGNPTGMTTPPPASKQPKGVTAFQPIPAPASPLSADKQQRLADLLQKYRADQITPEQYHAERAKILAEP